MKLLCSLSINWTVYSTSEHGNTASTPRQKKKKKKQVFLSIIKCFFERLYPLLKEQDFKNYTDG